MSDLFDNDYFSSDDENAENTNNTNNTEDIDAKDFNIGESIKSVEPDADANRPEEAYNPQKPYTPENPYSYGSPQYTDVYSTSDKKQPYSPYIQNSGGYSPNGQPIYSSAMWGQNQPVDSQSRASSFNPGQTNPYYHPSQNIQKEKKPKKGASKGFVALMLVLSVVLSSVAGFVTGFISNRISKLDSDDSSALVVNKAEIDEETAENLSDKPTSQIASEVADSVVEIVTEVMSTNSFYGQYISQGAGSGVIISQDGYIITNNHVIEGASSITVSLRDGTSYKAELVGTDSILDVALIKIEATGLKSAIFGDSDKLKVGDKAVAIGNPLGQLGGTVTDGIISALKRDVVIDEKTMSLLQTDTAINPGNSGGGLFDGQGTLVGLVVAKSSGEEIEGLGFAIPINNVIDVVEDLKTHGYVKGRVSIGMELIDLTNNLYTMYYYGNSTPGCYVYSVERNSNAEAAGIRAGDRIVSVNGTKVASKADVETALDTAKVGDKVVYEIDRQGSVAKLTVELEEYVPAPNIDDSGDDPFSEFNPFE